MTSTERSASGELPTGVSRRSAWFWVPFALLVAAVLMLGWLNASPWWAWVLVAGLLVALVVLAPWFLRRRALFRMGAWLVAASLVCGTAVLAHPGPQYRIAGGAERAATEPVETREGPVTGVRNDDGTVKIFAGVPYARPPVGELRWQAPQPPEPRSQVLVADRFSAVPVQSTTTFTTRALTQVLDIPLEEPFLNPYPVSEDSLYLNIWRPAGERLAQELGVETVAELRDLPVDRITEAAAAVGPHWRPSVDGYVLDRSPAEIYAAGDQLDVPTMIGSNADELSITRAFPSDPVTPAQYYASVQDEHGDDAAAFLDLYPGQTEEQVADSLLQAQADRVFTRAMYHWAHLQSRTGQAPAYLYYFTHTPPAESLQEYGAYHGAEVMYAFDNLGADDDADYGEADHQLRDQLSGYWLNFARTGDPNEAGLPVWLTFSEAPEHVMEIGTPSGMTARPRPEAIDYWMRYQGPVA